MIIKIKKLYDEGTEGMDRKGPDRGTCGEVKKRDTRSYLKNTSTGASSLSCN